ncbi:metallopeptidase family protein [Patescibacteria group bacterium]|nr:metallopeptidase family protein [Patescibacteria group bacterium]MBU1075100.1 metallopeptidase family protein [Patescibacteria group bacterium]MBU1952146.1 metallopeptidase family protein [Patescibacteria group bacterium]
MNKEIFEKMVTDAIIEVPKRLRKRIENLAFVVEEDSRPATIKEHGINYRGMLLGLYQGIPLSKRGVNYGSVLPDKITIFQKQIEQLAGTDPENIRKLVREVVHHEIGHYFGMDETTVRKWEQKRRKNNKIKQ